MRHLLVVAVVCCAVMQAQTPGETTTKEEPATFRARVNLVMVPVVVRDKQGRSVATLKQDDFQLLDKGRPQVITKFSVEHPGGPVGKNGSGKQAKGGSGAVEAPERYVAYLFDDLHLKFEDIARVRDAAWTHIRDSLGAYDRAAIYSTSGQTVAEFTDDKDKLRGTLFTLQPRPLTNRNFQECPDISFYMADLIQNRNDPMALSAAVRETVACMQGTDARSAESFARAAAQRVMIEGNHESRIAIGMVRDVVRRMGTVPGQRVIILASPGFLLPEDNSEKNDVIDRAIKANVTINSLGARGLYVDGMYDASRRSFNSEATRIKGQYLRDGDRASEDLLHELAYGTGGSAFVNNNDLAAGLRKLAEVPETVYVLGFSPQNLKLDGSFHALRVVLRTSDKLTASARRGYYAPRKFNDPMETAKEEIREAVFSREEVQEVPVVLATQFFKPNNDTARLTVVTGVNLKGLKYHVEEERQRNTLTIVCAVFDRNGNYVTGNQKTLEMRLLPATLERPTAAITIRSTFDVGPGGYLVRLVVRDAEEQHMSALNGAVDIP
jgi:VWFA-related protein